MRKREHESDWRKAKLEHYREYVAALAGVAQGRSAPTAQARYADAVNSLTLVAPPAVLKALYAFQDEISCRNTARSDEVHDRLFASLLAEMLRDKCGVKYRFKDSAAFRSPDRKQVAKAFSSAMAECSMLSQHAPWMAPACRTIHRQRLRNCLTHVRSSQPFEPYDARSGQCRLPATCGRRPDVHAPLSAQPPDRRPGPSVSLCRRTDT